MAEFLSGWKDIANYMGKGVRTVQRYGRERGLPARRISGKPKASVLVSKTELDIWIHAAFSHEVSHETLSPDLKKLKSHASELMAGIAQLKESMKNLAKAREELVVCEKTVRETARRVHQNVFETRDRKDGGLRVA